MAIEKGCKACLISAKEPDIIGQYNTVILGVDEYHTSEVLTLSLFYQLIHGADLNAHLFLIQQREILLTIILIKE